jgi:hypothetical protein
MIKLETGKDITIRQRSDEFLSALRDMQVGQSFVSELTSYNRNLIYAARVLLKREYITRSERSTGHYRVHRVK